MEAALPVGLLPAGRLKRGDLMDLGAFMEGRVLGTGYAGYLLGEDWVLALDLEDGGGADDAQFAVVRAGIRRLEAGFETVEQRLYRETSGPFSKRRELRRFFLLEGDRRLDDPFQQQVFSYPSLYARGDGAAMRYLFFCLGDGCGERGRLVPLIERDAGGAPGENAAFRLRLVQSGEAPQAYRWTGGPAG